MEKIKQFLKRNGILISLILLSIIVFYIFYNFNKNLIGELKINEQFEIFTNSLVAISVLIAIFQFHTYKNEVRETQNKYEAEQAILVAKEYSDKILPEIIDIRKDIDFKKVINIMNEIPLIKIEKFNMNELVNLLPEKKNKELYEIFSKISDDTRKKINIVLNRLEYMCMYLTTGVGNEETVYQSLHVTFLRLIKSFYFYIATENKDGKDKLYTNIIILFNIWAKRHSYNCELESKMIEETLTKIDEQIVKPPKVKR